MKVSEVGEKGIIRFLSREFTAENQRVIEGIGDDTSVTLQDGGRCLLATTDVLVEGIHYGAAYTEPRLLGRKAVSTSLSDIAAMGGRPTYLLISLIVPPDMSMEYIQAFYRGARERMDEFGVVLIGGNTSASPAGTTICVVALGEVSRDELLCRKGASEGDTLYVTGYLGDAAFGLELLRTGGISNEEVQRNDAAMRHLDPSPRVKAGRLLAERHLPSAMIDISDGLLCDVRHLVEASGCGATLTLPHLPLSPQVRGRLETHPDDIRLPLSGGEDYELLFAVPPAKAPRVSLLAEEIELPMTPIGTVGPKEGGVVVVDKNGERVQAEGEGFEHFRGL